MDFSDLTSNFMPLMTIVEIEKPRKIIRHADAVVRYEDFWKDWERNPEATSDDITEFEDTLMQHIEAISALVQREIDRAG